LVPQKLEVGSCRALITPINVVHNVFHGKHTEATSLGEQCLFFWTKPEAANIHGDTLASTARTMFDLTGLVDRIVIGFYGTLPARPRNVVRMVFAGALLKFCDAPRQRRFWNMYLFLFGLPRWRRRRDFYFPPSDVSPVVPWDLESHDPALSSGMLVALFD
jgi:hypothetical protein